MQRLFGLLFLIFSCINGLHAQSSFLPQNLGDKVNSTFDDFNPVLSPDGRTLYFTRTNHPSNNYGKYDSQDIWYAEYIDGKWTEAKPLKGFLNKGKYNAVLSITDDGQTMLVNGVYSKNKNLWKKRGFSIVKMSDDGWGKPQPVKIKRYSRINRGVQTNSFLSGDGQLLILSFTKKFEGKKNDLYYSTKKGVKWSKPKKLGNIINTRKFSEEAPYLSRTNDTLYFSSNRKGGKDKFDIYYSIRSDAGFEHWTPPIPLSDTINTPAWESYLKKNSRGSYAYYSSNASGSFGGTDIFKVKLFEENPFVLVYGKVYNKSTGNPMASAQLFHILVNGKPADSVKINYDSATYRAILPLRNKYVLGADLKYFTSLYDSIDVTKDREYKTIHLDLYLEPLPYVLLKGSLLVKDSKEIIPQNASPEIFVDGSKSDSAIIAYPSGTYQLMLRYGKMRKIFVNAQGFIKQEDTVELSNYKEYKEISKDLYVKSLPFVIISGKMLSKNTGLKIPSYSHPAILVNDMHVDSAQIDTSKGTYKIALPYGYSYSLKMVAAKYEPIPEVLDLSLVKTHKEIVRNLYAVENESKSAIITGKVIDKKTGKPVKPGTQFEIHVNNLPSLAAKTDTLTGFYELNVPLGVNHTINAKAPGYYPVYEMIDLTKEKGNIKVIRDLVIAPIEVGQSIRMNNIFFEFGKATLKKESFPELNRIVKFMNDYPSIKIEIAGHTDNVGKPDKNKVISHYRAQAVAHYIEHKGISDDRVSFKGYGQSKPVANNKTPQGRAVNRRVEFTILSK